MPGQQPHTIYLFRIVHIDNVEYLLSHGMYIRNHPHADPDYINIGDTGLIAQRNNYSVGVNPPNGVLGDYIPFYFGPLSPMLYNIETGYRGVVKRPQSDIVYMVCRLDVIVEDCAEWCFTDGHAKNALTTFYNDLANLGAVDWNLVSAKYWSNTEDDLDRMRRKQAEFLVKDHVPVNCIGGIIVYEELQKAILEAIITRLGLNIQVLVNPRNQYYY